MVSSKPFYLELTIQASNGSLGHIGGPMMLGRFCMLHAPGSSLADAVVSIVGRDAATGGWREYAQPVNSEVALEVATQIDAVGMPARAPDVSPVFDTSICWTNLLLQVKKDQQTVTFEIGVQSSGFEGPDADALRRLLHQLCSLCGYQGFDRSLIGAPVVAQTGTAADPVVATPSTWAAPQFCCYCGHDFGARGYPEDGGVPCANADCREPLLSHFSTCQAAGCGHSTPLSANFCWHCGVRNREQ